MLENLSRSAVAALVLAVALLRLRPCPVRASRGRARPSCPTSFPPVTTTIKTCSTSSASRRCARDAIRRCRTRPTRPPPIPYKDTMPDLMTFKDGTKVTTADSVAQAARGDRRGLRARGLRQDSQERPQGEVGSHEHHRRRKRRHRDGDQNAGRPRRQQRFPEDQGRHSGQLHRAQACRRAGADHRCNSVSAGGLRRQGGRGQLVDATGARTRAGATARSTPTASRGTTTGCAKALSA